MEPIDLVWRINVTLGLLLLLHGLSFILEVIGGAWG
jgi:uncharacterized protein YhhL (DUF1145 family)